MVRTNLQKGWAVKMLVVLILPFASAQYHIGCIMDDSLKTECTNAGEMQYLTPNDYALFTFLDAGQVSTNFSSGTPLAQYFLNSSQCSEWEYDHALFSPLRTGSAYLENGHKVSTNSCYILWNFDNTTSDYVWVEYDVYYDSSITAAIANDVWVLFLIFVFPSILATCCCFKCYYCCHKPPYCRNSCSDIQYLLQPAAPLSNSCNCGDLTICGAKPFVKPMVPFPTWYLNEHTVMWIWRPHLYDPLGVWGRALCTIFIIMFIFIFETVWKSTLLPQHEGITDIPSLFKSKPKVMAILVTLKVVISALVAIVFQMLAKIAFRKFAFTRKKMLWGKRRDPTKKLMGLIINFLILFAIVGIAAGCIAQLYFGRASYIDEIQSYVLWFMTTLLTSNLVPVKYVQYRIYGTIGKEEKKIETVFVNQIGHYYVQRKGVSNKQLEEPLLGDDDYPT